MKKILWIVLILVILLVLFFWLTSKESEKDQADLQQEETQTRLSSPDATSNNANVVETQVVPTANQEAEVDTKPQQLNAFASVKNARVVAPPPGTNVAAIYMRMANSGRGAIKVVSVDSVDFEEMMFHQTVIRDGVASMEHVEYLDLQPSGSLTLEPNGLHIMGMGPKKDLKAGGRVTVNFTFDNGQISSAILPVR